MLKGDRCRCQLAAKLHRALAQHGEGDFGELDKIAACPDRTHVADDGMERECAVNLDHVQTVSRGKIGAVVTTLSRERMRQVRDAIHFSLDL